jgi:hypothetical protein
MAVQALRTRRKQLYDFAEGHLPIVFWRELNVPSDRTLERDAKRVQEALVAFGIEVPEELLVRQKGATVYHCNNTYFEYSHANILFEAGFCDIDSTDEYDFTPLHKACLGRQGFDHGLA